MSKFARSCVLLAACLVPIPSSPAAEPTRGPLVDVEWLASHLGRADVVVLDASPRQVYANNHIPGALSADFLTYGFPERSLADMEQRYQSWGLTRDKTVVIYDQGGTYMATRLHYALYLHGFPAENLVVLDGGLAKWQEKGQPVTKDEPAPPTKGTFRIGETRDEVRVRLPEFLAASGDPVNNVLLEALGPESHFGAMAFFNRAGHVPNAVMAPSTDFFNADKTFKSPDQIRRMMTFLGVTPDQHVLNHCGGGVAASVPFFALKFLLGYPKVSLYQESLMGWLSDDRELPLWTYDAPWLMRDATWLDAWAGQRLRMFRRPEISIIDVRPAAAYAEGHVPFAVNVAAEVFRGNVSSSERLGQVLGAAGVDRHHEAVIVSGAGLTKEAALAFVLLEKAGQRRVSLLTASMDQWASQGLPVSKDPTLVGTATAPKVMAVPATTYAAAPHADVITTDPTDGEFPAVFVASGATVPSRVADAKVVHVPYTSLLNDDGTPKPAKEIWSILSKAGVPRYAELICYAEDPGEAAATYFLLKLMGFPRVKVLVG